MPNSDKPVNIKDFLSSFSQNKHVSIGCHYVNLEVDGVKRPEFDKYLAMALQNAYADPDRVAAILKREGFDEAAKYVSGKFPSKDNPFHIRNGDYGEVLTQVFLQDLFMMNIPIVKLRYKTNWQKAAFGVDVIAFRLDDTESSKDTVVFAEVKASKTKIYGVDTVFREIEGLVEEGQVEVNQKMRNAIHFICDRLAEQKEHELEERLYRFTDSFTNPHFVENFAPVLVRDKSTWKEDALDCVSLSSVEPDRVKLFVFCIHDLEQAIDVAYENANLKEK